MPAAVRKMHPLARRLFSGWAMALLVLCAAGPPVLAQDSTDPLSFAQSLSESREYFRAVTEYLRYLHDFPQGPARDRALLGMASAQLSGNEAARALSTAKRLVEEHPDSPLVPEAWLVICRARLAMDPDEGLSCLSALANSPDPALSGRAAWRLGFALLDRGDWAQARQAFSAVTPESGHDARQLAAALDPAPNLPYKNPTKAGALAVVPGLGHVYLGRYQDALIALVLNAGLGIAAWEAFDQDMPALGGVLSVAAFGFYAGNFYGAVTGARKANERARHEFVRDLTERHGPRADSGSPATVLAWTWRF